MPRFEVVSKYANSNIALPKRSTAHSAGYDFEVAEDIKIPPETEHNIKLWNYLYEQNGQTTPKEVDLKDLADATKITKARPTLVPTGIKCQLNPDQYLELSVRSSCPLKSWLILANGVGIVDSDYYNNPDNEGHIYFQIINLGPVEVVLHKGDKIGQGVIKHFDLVDDDKAEGLRTGGFGSTTDTSKPITWEQITIDELIEKGIIPNG